MLRAMLSTAASIGMRFWAPSRFQVRVTVSGGRITVLHEFCSDEGCRDGRQPTVEPTLDSDGALLGVTEQGGVRYLGMIYRAVP